MSEQKELIYRVEEKKKKFQAELESLQNDMADSSKKNKKVLENKIKEMSDDLVKARNDFSESVSKKINQWLD